MIQLEQEMMNTHTTFKIGGPAAYYMIPENEDEIMEALDFARVRKLPFYLLGRGSNVLFSDEGYPGEIGRAHV